MNHGPAIVLMTLAMAGFAVSDTTIKLLTATISLGQVIVLSAVASLVVFVVALWRQGGRLFTRKALGKAMVIRNAGEAIGTVGYTTALARSDLSVAAAILQSQPLIVTLAAWLFLGEPVGWRRMGAIMVGFFGVLLIIRPGADNFEPASLWAVVGAIGLTARDLGSRALPKDVPTSLAAAWALIALTAVGVLMMQGAGGWQAPDPREFLLLTITIVGVIVAYFAITEALRRAPVATVSPFRYTRMIFVLALAWAVFGEIPDLLMWVGLTLVIGSGLYAVARERRLAQAT